MEQCSVLQEGQARIISFNRLMYLPRPNQQRTLCTHGATSRVSIGRFEALFNYLAAIYCWTREAASLLDRICRRAMNEINCSRSNPPTYMQSRRTRNYDRLVRRWFAQTLASIKKDPLSPAKSPRWHRGDN